MIKITNNQAKIILTTLKNFIEKDTNEHESLTKILSKMEKKLQKKGGSYDIFYIIVSEDHDKILAIFDEDSLPQKYKKDYSNPLLDVPYFIYSGILNYNLKLEEDESALLVDYFEECMDEYLKNKREKKEHE